MDPLCYLCFFFAFAILSSLVVTCWQRADLLALLCMVFSCVFVTFLHGDLGQVCYLIVPIPDLCILHYFDVTERIGLNCLIVSNSAGDL